jgi:hypothetical protein
VFFQAPLRPHRVQIILECFFDCEPDQIRHAGVVAPSQSLQVVVTLFIDVDQHFLHHSPP